MKNILKILFIFLIFIISGCSNFGVEYREKPILIEEYQDINKLIRVREDFGFKDGANGSYYTDYENTVIIKKVPLDIKDVYEDIFYSFNFYVGREFTGIANAKIKENEDGSFLIDLQHENPNRYIKGKIFKKGDSQLVVAVSVREGDIDKFYDEVFK